MGAKHWIIGIVGVWILTLVSLEVVSPHSHTSGRHPIKYTGDPKLDKVVPAALNPELNTDPLRNKGRLIHFKLNGANCVVMSQAENSVKVAYTAEGGQLTEGQFDPALFEWNP